MTVIGNEPPASTPPATCCATTRPAKSTSVPVTDSRISGGSSDPSRSQKDFETERQKFVSYNGCRILRGMTMAHPLRSEMARQKTAEATPRRARALRSSGDAMARLPDGAGAERGQPGRSLQGHAPGAAPTIDGRHDRMADPAAVMEGLPKPAKRPCGSCPYRRDVPAGIWAAEEYRRLADYDGETHEQRSAKLFLCHRKTGALCAGWIACHDTEHLMALRLHPVDPTVHSYRSPVGVFGSGAEARDHGLSGLTRTDARARRVIRSLMRRQDLGKNQTGRRSGSGKDKA